MEILKALVQIRKDKKIRQSEVYSQLGINQCMFSRYENFKVPMPLRYVIQYADILGYELRLLKK